MMLTNKIKDFEGIRNLFKISSEVKDFEQLEKNRRFFSW